MSEFSEDKLIQKWLEGTITESEKNSFLNDSVWGQVVDVVEASAHLRPVFKNSKEDSWNSIQHRIHQEKVVPLPKNASNIYWKKQYSWAAIAASIILVLGFVYLFNFSKTTLSTSYGEIAKFELPDGSKVHLGPMSEISYDTYDRSSSEKQILYLDGEAYFEVEKGKGLFEVQTKEVKATVLGTSFLIRAHQNNFSLDCVEGKVKVAPKSEKSDGEIIEKGLSIDVVGGEFSKPYYHNANQVLHWFDGKYYFDKKKLGSVILTLERLYDVSVHFENNELKDIPYSGFIEKGDLEKSLEVICKPLSLKYEIKEDVITIYK